MGKKGNGNEKSAQVTSRSLLSAPPQVCRERSARMSSTQDAMDELLDETFNSDSLEDSYSLVGLDEPETAPDSDTPILAGPTSPEARAKRYKKLRTNNEFWDEFERVDDES